MAKQSERGRDTSVSIGAISKATNIPINTLRTWERRYGFPVPQRTSGGHRVYETTVIAHLRLIARALRLGHRASQVVSQDQQALAELVGQAAAVHPVPSENLPDESKWLEAAMSFDANALTLLFRSVVAERGLLSFVSDYSHMFLRSVGNAWDNGRLKIEHEHFASEVLRDFLAGQWRPMSASAKGPMVVCAALPEEQHYLALHLAACIFTARGYRVLFLGPNTPRDSLVAATHSSGAQIVVITCSAYCDELHVSDQLRLMRDELPDDTSIWVGGAGAPQNLDGVRYFGTLEMLKSALVT
ncbi:MAG: MerR family transcriptional regulator [Myxococcota bacterium]|nr:MerR family transcriptional regulator [Myxococcota bacterium]